MPAPKRIEIVGLPYPWIAFQTPNTEKLASIPYFVNSIDNSTQLEFPTVKIEKAHRIYTDANLPYPWICFQSKTKGNKYYVQPKLATSIWVRPKESEALKVPSPPSCSTIQSEKIARGRDGNATSTLKRKNKEGQEEPTKQKAKARVNGEILKRKKEQVEPANQKAQTDCINEEIQSMDTSQVASTSFNNVIRFYEQDFLIVCDTCSLLKQPDIVQFLIDNRVVVYIPKEVQGELDHRKNDPKFQAIVSTLNRYLRNVTTRTSDSYSALLILEHALRRRDVSNLPDNDSKILASALELAQIGKANGGLNVVLLTEDNILAVRANSYFDHGVLSTGVEALRRIVLQKITRDDSQENLPSVNETLFEKIRDKLKESTSVNKPDLEGNVIRGSFRPEQSEEYSRRVEGFKCIVESVIEELVKRFGESTKYGHKVEIASHMQDLRRALNRSTSQKAQYCFNRFLSTLEKVYTWLDGPKEELERMGPSSERWKLYSYLCCHHPDVLQTLENFAADEKFVMVPDYFDNLIDTE